MPTSPQQDAPKTPGWSLGLFGLLKSSAKKPRAVESSTGHTGQHPRPTPSTNITIARSHLDFPETSHAFTNVESFSGIDPPPNVMVSSPQPASSRSLAVASKSPWKSPAAMNGMRPTQALVRKTPASTKVVPVSAKKRHKPYKPMSDLLVKPRSRRAGRANIDRTLAVSALEQSKGVFAPSTRQIEEKKNYASFKAGKRLLGANHRLSRLPTPMESTDDIGAQRGIKRQKQVSFEDRDKPLVVDFNTPSGKLAPREATPFKMMDSVEESKSVDSALPASPSIKFPPRPPQSPHLAAPPYEEFAEAEDLGDPVAADMPNLFDFSVVPSNNTRDSSLRPTSFDLNAFEREQEERRKVAKAKEDEKDEAEMGGPNPKKPRIMEYWTCTECPEKRKNPDDEGNCKCGARRKAAKITSWGNTFSYLDDMWTCASCKTKNKQQDATECASCHAPRAGAGVTSNSATAPGTTDSTAANSSITPSGFVFNAQGTATTTSTAGGFTFGTGPFGSTTTHNNAGQASASASTGFTFKAPESGTSVSGPSIGGVSSSTASPAAGTMNGNKPKFGFLGTQNDQSGEEQTSGRSPKTNVDFGRSENITPNTPAVAGESRIFQAPVPATEPSSKRSRQGLNGEVVVPNSTSKVPEQKPFPSLFGSQSTAANPTETSASTGSQESQSFSFGASKTVSDASVQQPQASAGGLFGQAASSSVAPVIPAPTAQLTSPLFGSTPLAGTEDRSKRRRDGGDTNGISQAAGGTGPGGSSVASAVAFGARSTEHAPSPKLTFTSSQGGNGIFGSKTAANGEATQKESFESTTHAVPAFGSLATTAATTPGDKSEAQKLFGKAQAPTGAPFQFGQKQAPTSATFQFGGGSAPSGQGQTTGADTATTSAPAFGSSGSTPAPAAPFGGALSGQVANASSFGSSAGSGGQENPPKAEQPNMFGQASTAPSNPFSAGQASAPAAGAPPAPAFSFSAGSTPAPAAPFGGTPAPPTSASLPAFGTTSAQNSAPLPSFGASTVPTSGPGFGGATNTPSTFGAAPPAAAGPFGGTPGFGSAAPPSTSAPMFGTTPASAAPTPGFFGTSTSQGPGSAPFGPFGGGTPNGGSFGGFGNSTPAQQIPANGMGGFPPQQPSGFGGGFGGPSNAPTPAATTPAAGMGGFNIGTGGGKSTGARRRFIRAKRPGGTGAPRQA